MSVLFAEKVINMEDMIKPGTNTGKWVSFEHNMKIVKPGEKVLLCDNTVIAQVVAVYIRFDCKVSYEVVWWSNGSRNTQVVEEFEINIPEPDSMQTIGFVNFDTPGQKF